MKLYKILLALSLATTSFTVFDMKYKIISGPMDDKLPGFTEDLELDIDRLNKSVLGYYSILNRRVTSALDCNTVDFNTIESLVKKGADVNTQNLYGNTTLMLAIINNNNQFAYKFLKQPDIDLNIYNKDGFTALMLAIEADNAELVNALLSIGANPNILKDSNDTENETALTLAIKENKPKLVNALLQHKHTDPNKHNGYNDPIEIAIENENKEVVALLLQRDDINLKLVDKQPVELAIETGNQEIIKLLQDAVSKLSGSKRKATEEGAGAGDDDARSSKR